MAAEESYIDVDALDQVEGGGGVTPQVVKHSPYSAVVDRSTGARSYHLRGDPSVTPQFIIIDDDDQPPPAAAGALTAGGGGSGAASGPRPLQNGTAMNRGAMPQQVVRSSQLNTALFPDEQFNSNKAGANQQQHPGQGGRKRARDIETISPLPDGIAFDHPENAPRLQPIPQVGMQGVQPVGMARASTAPTPAGSRSPLGQNPDRLRLSPLQPQQQQAPVVDQSPLAQARADDTDIQALRDQLQVEKVFKNLWPKKFTKDIFINAAKSVVGDNRCLQRGNFWSSFQRVEFLGEGSFGFVWKATTFDGEVVAVKCAPINFDVPEAIDDGFGIIREIAANRVLNSRNVHGVLPLHACFLVEAAESLPPHLTRTLRQERSVKLAAERAEEEKEEKERRDAHKARMKAAARRLKLDEKKARADAKRKKQKANEKKKRLAAAAKTKKARKPAPKSKKSTAKGGRGAGGRGRGRGRGSAPNSRRLSPVTRGKKNSVSPAPSGRGAKKKPAPGRGRGRGGRGRQVVESSSSSDDEESSDDDDDEEEETDSDAEEEEADSDDEEESDSDDEGSDEEEEEEEDDSDVSDSSEDEDTEEQIAIDTVLDEADDPRYSDTANFPPRMPAFFGLTKDDALNAEATLMMVTNLCDGDVESLVKKNLTVEQRKTMAEEVAYSVSCALKGMHKIGMLHLDLKPANILFRRRPSSISVAGGGGNSPTMPAATSQLDQQHQQREAQAEQQSHAFTVTSTTDFSQCEFFLADFGNIHLVTSGQGPQDPVDGCAIGTYEYMDWEALENKKCDRMTDSFSLGCVLNEILTSKMLMPSCAKKHQRHTTACYTSNAKKEPPLVRQMCNGGYDVKQAMAYLVRDLTFFDRRYRLKAADTVARIRCMTDGFGHVHRRDATGNRHSTHGGSNSNAQSRNDFTLVDESDSSSGDDLGAASP